MFAEALTAFGELVGGGRGRPVTHQVEVTADDDPMLLAEWLGELIYLGEAKGFVPERIAALELADGRLAATVEGREGEPRPLVKAVTLHRLELRQTNGWRARVVLDV